jgi:hypothetical protein
MNAFRHSLREQCQIIVHRVSEGFIREPQSRECMSFYDHHQRMKAGRFRAGSEEQAHVEAIAHTLCEELVA